MHVLVDGNFPGGNIFVETLKLESGNDNDSISVLQEPRDSLDNWFYWCFRAREASKGKITFQFRGNIVGVRGPAVSLDKGETWKWLGAESSTQNSFTYCFDGSGDEVRFCFTIPYLESNLKSFLQRHERSSHMELASLCTTGKMRNTELIRLGCIGSEPKFRTIITCRHHCCESIASYSLEGIMEAVLSESESGKWLRENVEFMVVPFIDKDGVEDGDQGKSRYPHDHNRDYSGDSIYPSVKKLRDIVPSWSQGKLKLALDLHCPHIRGSLSERLYMVGAENPKIWDEQCRFGRILENCQTGKLGYRAIDNLPFGADWNISKNYSNGKCFSDWAGEIPGVKLSTSFEIPYANCLGQEINVSSAREFGEDLARTLYFYMKSEC